MPENIHRNVAFIFLIFGTGLVALVAVNNKIEYKVISDLSERMDKYRYDDLGIQRDQSITKSGAAIFHGHRPF